MKRKELEEKVNLLARELEYERSYRWDDRTRTRREIADLRRRLDAIETKRARVPVVVTQVSPHEWHWRIKGEPQQNGIAHSRELALMEAREAAAEWDRQEVKV